jgi:ABC-type bacteriocin/lantibiotic exporter with double-glycine peptidase domain
VVSFLGEQSRCGRASRTSPDDYNIALSRASVYLLSHRIAPLSGECRRVGGFQDISLLNRSQAPLCPRQNIAWPKPASTDRHGLCSKSIKLIRPFRQIWEIIPKCQRRRVLSYFPLTLLSSFLELGGILTLLPFLWILTQPERLQEHPQLVEHLAYIGLDTPESILAALGAIIVFAFLARDAVAIGILWFQSQTQAKLQATLSENLLSLYLAQPYDWYIHQHSSVLKQSLSRLPRIVAMLLRPLATFISQLLHALLLGCLLFYLHPRATVSLFLVLGLTCVTLYRTILPRITSVALDVRESQVVKMKTAGAAFNSIKEAKLFACEPYYLDHHEKEARKLARLESLNDVLSHLPAYFTRSLFAVIAMTILFLSFRHGLGGAKLAELGVYLVALSRVSRCMQNCTRSLGTIQTESAQLEELHQSLGRKPTATTSGRQSSTESVHGHSAFQTLQLKNVHFQYCEDRRPALSDISLEIRPGETISIVGPTRAGKSTLLDLLTGLLEPQSGVIEVDGERLEERVREWQSLIGYVSEDSFFTERSLAENIAIGFDLEDIDFDSLDKAMALAAIDDLASRLPQGVYSSLGERGRAVSKGQRQRISIARALYRDPKIIILDEATSALDRLTENKVMQNLLELKPQKTIILVTHQLSAAKMCDRLFVLNEGQLVGHGTYDELTEDCPLFNDLITVAK